MLSDSFYRELIKDAVFIFWGECREMGFVCQIKMPWDPGNDSAYDPCEILDYCDSVELIMKGRRIT
jgi:hypothetical protein